MSREPTMNSWRNQVLLAAFSAVILGLPYVTPPCNAADYDPPLSRQQLDGAEIGDIISIILPGTESMELSLVNIENPSFGRVWSASGEESLLLAVAQGDWFLAYVYTRDGGAFQIEESPRHPMTVEPMRSQSPCGGVSLTAVDGEQPDIPEFPSQGDCDGGTVVDVLALYTPLARDAAGGTAAIRDHIWHSALAANLALYQSAINLYLNVVHVREIEYDEDGTYGDHLDRLVATDDGIMDEAHTWRDDFRADVVSLFVDDDDDDLCGLGKLNPRDDRYGFTVVNESCDYLVFGHEVGHNLGCCHARGDGGGCDDGGIYPYSWGWRFWVFWPNFRARTMMAYAPGTRIPQFSNPDVYFFGQATGCPLGTPCQAHNALTISQTRYSVSLYRCSLDLDIWVDFNYSGDEDGSGLRPFNTLAEAVEAADPGDRIGIVSGESDETLTISKAVTCIAVGGPVTVGEQTLLGAYEPD